MRLMVIVMLSLMFCGWADADSGATEQNAKKQSIDLDQYILLAGPIKVGGSINNASGLTYSPISKSLFLVCNRPPKVIELGLDGSRKRVIPLLGFNDTEGITYIRSNSFAVVEEKRGTVCIIEINQSTTTIDRADAEIITIDSKPAGNKGLEGVSYDPKRGLFYVVKEKDPRKIYQYPWPAEQNSPSNIVHPWNVQQKPFSLKDLSDIYSHPGSGNLLILSDESASIVETTACGKELGRLSLKKGGKSGLQKDITQAEGITLADNGSLYIVSEPNLLYVFNKKSAVLRKIIPLIWLKTIEGKGEN